MKNKKIRKTKTSNEIFSSAYHTSAVSQINNNIGLMNFASEMKFSFKCYKAEKPKPVMKYLVLHIIRPR
jgi:hypothetical protein